MHESMFRPLFLLPSVPMRYDALRCITSLLPSNEIAVVIVVQGASTADSFGGEAIGTDLLIVFFGEDHPFIARCHRQTLRQPYVRTLFPPFSLQSVSYVQQRVSPGIGLKRAISHT
jgi:hypothetical protein